MLVYMEFIHIHIHIHTRIRKRIEYRNIVSLKNYGGCFFSLVNESENFEAVSLQEGVPSCDDRLEIVDYGIDRGS